jgi:hypothetical protein
MAMLFLIPAALGRHQRTPICLEVTGLDDYRSPTRPRRAHYVTIAFETNHSSDREDCTELFHEAAELAASFTPYLDFVMAFDRESKVERVVAFYSERADGYFRINGRMIPIQITTKMLHLAARIAKKERRDRKEAKYPGIARIKKELRNVHRLLKRATDEETIGALNATRADLVNQLVTAVAPEKQAYRRVKLANWQIRDHMARKAANRAARELKPRTEKNGTKPLTFKKVIDSYRKGWRECRAEEAEVDVEEERQRIEFEMNRRREDEDDSEDAEDFFKMMKTMKAFSEPGEDTGELDQRLEYMEKLREKRHQRQKREGTYRPRDEEGNYKYDDPNIRVGVDDPHDLRLDVPDTSPIKRKKDKKEKKQEEEELAMDDGLPGQYGDL